MTQFRQRRRTGTHDVGEAGVAGDLPVHLHAQIRHAAPAVEGSRLRCQLVQSTTPSGSGSPEATPKENGFSPKRGLAQALLGAVAAMPDGGGQRPAAQQGQEAAAVRGKGGHGIEHGDPPVAGECHQ
ncbi:hypothetical protein [Pseudarthrobacter raffinosi]|uniref:hypothetical protein n=1 Tax=Pseudarthrobacter raffinosi TaxID=2953651 RepID=UPI00208F6E35|nr:MULTISPECIES: hypothetical protein [unclassified Pseudarthrobacter]MCO4238646.1 hypothetical protein [Pseudarthrobacter sp. MDT3-28]MCO4249538.1 hypothetical protein [Pseudarthrobacter sp. MDT3-9]MCO4261458.1 hypothetical protein [Pseudarthrobacter sp. MDT3-26]